MNQSELDLSNLEDDPTWDLKAAWLRLNAHCATILEENRSLRAMVVELRLKLESLNSSGGTL